MSKIEVNQISSQCGSTLTIGQSGDSIQLACGATQTGFGRTGTVDWDTTAKTASFTAVSGNGYFVNTTSTAITVTLPAGSAGSIVSLKDYANTWQTNNVTVTPNGTDKINGANGNSTLNTQDQSVTLVYVDSTKGWRAVQDSTSDVSGAVFITATGGTITTCGDYKIHTFTGPGTFCVSCAGNPFGSTSVDYLVVAGGGGGGARGGGGAGGFRESSGAASGCYTASPLGACVSALPLSVQGYPIVVGGGGATACNSDPGSNSSFSTITSQGGGGQNNCDPNREGKPGGSGGGGGDNRCNTGGAGNTPPVSPPQGTPGAPGQAAGPSFVGGGGGGGALATGTPGQPTGTGQGGPGATTSISGSPTAYAGGGGGAGNSSSPQFPNPLASSGGIGGGGRGTQPACGPTGTAGTVNTGGGGGGGNAGGSGIVIIRYKYQ